MIGIGTLVKNAHPILSLIRAEVESILGKRPGNAQVLLGDQERGKRFKVLLQQFDETQLIALPHPQTRGLTDDYMASFQDVLGDLI